MKVENKDQNSFIPAKIRPPFIMKEKEFRALLALEGLVLRSKCNPSIVGPVWITWVEGQYDVNGVYGYKEYSLATAVARKHDGFTRRDAMQMTIKRYYNVKEGVRDLQRGMML